MSKGELPPIKYDEKGRPMYPPQVLRKWNANKARQYHNARAQKTQRYGGIWDENRPNAGEMTGSEWLMLHGKTMTQIERVQSRDRALQQSDRVLRDAIVKSIIETMPADEWAAVIENMREAMKAKPPDDETIEQLEQRMRICAMAFDRVLKAAEIAMKAEGGKFEQAPAPVHNTLNINDPNAIEAFLNALKLKGYRIEGPENAK